LPGAPLYTSPGYGGAYRDANGRWQARVASQRLDATPPSGGPAASDPDFTEKQLFADAGVDYAILLPLGLGRPMANPEHEAAATATTNNWLAETWLSKFNHHGRYYGALRVPLSDPQLAAREIEKWAGHPAFVEVMLVPYVSTPFGRTFYDPIYEAATRHNLPIAIHVNRGAGMGLLTPVGISSYFWEHHGSYPLMYGAHFTSLLCEGVFERFPTLKVVFVEGGVSWALPLVWRLDNHYERLRSEVPSLKRRPSEYAREHVYFSTQPIEEPDDPHDLVQALEWLGAERTLMFATDYPHWDADDPVHVFGRLRLPQHVKDRILRDNALELYGLPRTRRA
ncbi:MAG: amidohydrolase, partial [Chloroflexi bacterium]|nr:amidohydrolase [Chloroflexota bacterium]